jgi:hypothetical protein
VGALPVARGDNDEALALLSRGDDAGAVGDSALTQRGGTAQLQARTPMFNLP